MPDDFPRYDGHLNSPAMAAQKKPQAQSGLRFEVEEPARRRRALLTGPSRSDSCRRGR
ncbi:hypothetical protein RAJCM14343_5191 [Rhodococcus aetherivorans]|uniref:Uncharacterized protein n=1 Tax=Rhodococcus aetherivorans TaxID=191292 RepID=A0ABQ0YTU4_9NOCA|nr:hypothetical protein RAJCM14343_5191 [Rhodococcus aetherivorans]